jgi:hypothetical protein
MVPSLSDFHAGRNIPSNVVSFAPRAVGAARVGYQGAYAVLSGTDYAAFLRHVGDKVELIGQVHSVVHRFGINRRPYVFVNFSNWQGLAVKIAIWSDAFAAAGELPTAAWVGRWLSMTALVEPPYPGKTKKGVTYTHISLNLTQRGQMQALTAEEAAFRLKGGPAPRPPTGQTRGSNSDVLDKMAGRSRPNAPVAPTSARPAPAPSPVSANQAVIDRMRRSAATAPTAAAARQAPPPPAPASRGYRPAPPKKDSHWGLWLVAIIIGLSVLRSCAH